MSTAAPSDDDTAERDIGGGSERGGGQGVETAAVLRFPMLVVLLPKPMQPSYLPRLAAALNLDRLALRSSSVPITE